MKTTKFKIPALLLVISLFTVNCATENKNTGKGAGIGAAAGAVAGAIIGHQSGNREKGAAIGAVLGAGVGAVAGKRLDEQEKELAKIAETKRTEQGLITKLKSDILFDTGKAVLKPEAAANIGKVAEIIKKYPEDVLVVKGYTDNTGSSKINDKLSTDRAQAVMQKLVSRGVPASVVAVQGLGPSFPVGSNDTAEGRKANRRVEIEISVDESKVPKK